MDLAALILAIVAIVLFLFRPVDLALAVLTGALICQFVHLTGHVIVVH